MLSPQTRPTVKHFSFLRFHLPTAILMTLVAAGFLWKNLQIYDYQITTMPIDGEFWHIIPDVEDKNSFHVFKGSTTYYSPIDWQDPLPLAEEIEVKGSEIVSLFGVRYKFGWPHAAGEGAYTTNQHESMPIAEMYADLRRRDSPVLTNTALYWKGVILDFLVFLISIFLTLYASEKTISYCQKTHRTVYGDGGDGSGPSDSK